MRRLLPLLALCTLPLQAAELTLERLFAEPPLAGTTPRSLKLSPDGRQVVFLRGKADDQFQLDLWSRDVVTGEERRLVDSRTLLPAAGELSDEEKARRERLRIAQLSGIVSYDFSRDGRRLLFSLQGDLFVYDREAGEGDRVTRLTRTEAHELDPGFSPDGGIVGYLREGELYLFDLEQGEEMAVTTGAGEGIAHGVAEFIAQEEMDRYTGYWISRDASKVAYTRVDETGVRVETRTEIYADGARSFEQRYPAAGTDNAVVELFVKDLETGEVVRVDLGSDKDIYLARVDWFPDNRHLAVQRQSRDQKTLDLLKVDASTGQAQALLRETGDSWVDLHNDLVFLADGEGFLWNSARDGYDHLYLYALDGALRHQLTRGPWVVTAGGRGESSVKAVDPAGGWVYFTGTYTSPVERHLYRVPLDGSGADQPETMTSGSGWHAVSMDRAGTVFLDHYSSPDLPPRVSLEAVGGKRLAWIAENPLDETHPYHRYRDSHGRTDFGTLEASDGQLLHYSLLRPADFDPDRQYPVIVRVYGGPAAQMVSRAWGDPLDHWLTQQGYLVFRLDNRGTPERGTAFETPIYMQAATVEVDDQLVGVDYLRSLEYVDGDRIGIFGWSYGGYMALMCAMKSDVFAAAVSGAPVTDWRLYDTHYTEHYMGDPRKHPEAYEAASVLSYYRQLDTPLLVMHGMADDNVLLTHATALFERLQKDNLPFEMMLYPGEKHGLLRDPQVGLHGYRVIAEFFGRHLKPASK